MELSVNFEMALRLIISFCIGAAIGLEREYHSKAAGLRTMIMVCLGSTIFSALSLHMGANGSPDRIAASIVTGIGFLGAGVIFKEGLTVTGITTATTTWMCAALGTAVGAGEYFISIFGSIIVMFVLILLGRFQILIEEWHQVRSYQIVLKFTPAQNASTVLEESFKLHSIEFKKLKDYKERESLILVYELSGRMMSFDKLNNDLKLKQEILSFIY
ncbi:MgtC/SapB family protein [Peredibacter sp. HCB2-198]|uniref:MgtC/SapB family protein n=1 Tax=Peredibacter sp. HCB2-198 TaxID=3383025 RepID=UPI0038B5113F